MHACAADVVDEEHAFNHPITQVHDLTRCALACSLEIVDESSQHAGHAGSRMTAGAGGETHFNVKVVSAAFEGLNTVKRHRQIYGVSGNGINVAAVCRLRHALPCPHPTFSLSDVS
jgi:stress-induced morphogen